MVKCVEVMNGLIHERMMVGGKDEVIGDTHRNGFGKNDGIYEKGVHWTKTANV